MQEAITQFMTALSCRCSYSLSAISTSMVTFSYCV